MRAALRIGKATTLETLFVRRPRQTGLYRWQTDRLKPGGGVGRAQIAGRGNGMMWHVMVKFIGGDCTVCTLEIGSEAATRPSARLIDRKGTRIQRAGPPDDACRTGDPSHAAQAGAAWPGC